ncbi:hypothetical protein OFN25_32440, partial [Escherichia coli]|nr:hypothetical protein [Escherichia coli]
SSQDRVLHQGGSDRRVIGTAQLIENGSLMEPFFYLWARGGYLSSALYSVACSHTTVIRHISRPNTGYKKTGA